MMLSLFEGVRGTFAVGPALCGAEDLLRETMKK
jgi:hypothetical protein